MALSNFKKIGDNLTNADYNGIISLLRHFITHSETILIRDTVNGEYGTYNFDLGDSTIIDAGIVISDETRTAQPKIQLKDNFFKFSTYTLKLTIMHYNGVNILDNITDNLIEKETLELELIPNQWINIPISDLSDGYIISLNAEISIKHDKPEIHYIDGIEINKAEPPIIQTGETSDIYAQIKDYDGENYDLSDATGKTVYFFEKIEPTLKVSAQPSIIQTNDTSDIYAKVTDEDGSLAKNVKTYFYKQLKETTLFSDATEHTQTYNNGQNVTVLSPTIPLEDIWYGWYLTFQFKADTEGRLFIGDKNSAVPTNPQYSFFIGANDNNKISYGQRDTYTDGESVDIDSTSYHQCEIWFDYHATNLIIFKIDGVEVGTKQEDFMMDYNEYVIGTVAWGNGTVYVKDIVLKRLDE